MYSEELILSALRRRDIWSRFRKVIKPGHFSDTDNRKIFTKIDSIHRANDGTVEIPLAAFAATLPPLSTDGSGVESVLADFAVRVRLHDLASAATAARNQTGLLEEGSLTEILDNIQTVDEDDEVQKRIVVQADDDVQRIPTGIDFLDAALGGGLSVGELVCVGAAPYTGKTHWLVKLASMFAMRGVRTFHFMMEDLPGDVLRYYNQASSGFGKAEVKALERSLTILNYNDKATTVDDIDRATRYLVRGARGPFVIVVDYADILATVGMKQEEGRFKLKAIYTGLRKVYNKYDAIGLTASQLGAAAWTKQYPDMSDLDESKIGKGGTIDVGLLWSQLHNEKETGLGRLVVAKARGRSVRYPYLGVRVDWDTFHVESEEAAFGDSKGSSDSRPGAPADQGAANQEQLSATELALYTGPLRKPVRKVHTDREPDSASTSVESGGRVSEAQGGGEGVGGVQRADRAGHASDSPPGESQDSPSGSPVNTGSI